MEQRLVNGGGDVLVRGQMQGRAWRAGPRSAHASRLRCIAAGQRSGGLFGRL